MFIRTNYYLRNAYSAHIIFRTDFCLLLIQIKIRKYYFLISHFTSNAFNTAPNHLFSVPVPSPLLIAIIPNLAIRSPTSSGQLGAVITLVRYSNENLKSKQQNSTRKRQKCALKVQNNTSIKYTSFLACMKYIFTCETKNLSKSLVNSETIGFPGTT